ncbi:MAG: hypothetical protein MI892_30495 [Desulfobacterales bacterium]|nr:hypothetical protein [Desulfobacterales bacterium]
MDSVIQLILTSGKSALNLVLYVLLPVMVIMMSFMRLLEAKGVVHFVAKVLAPVLNRFGVPGIGVFAALQLTFISFAAPLASFRMMERDRTRKRSVAATLAMVLTMSQANVIFPMAVVGLNVGIIMATSVVGGLFAAALTYFCFTRNFGDGVDDGFMQFQPDHKAKTLDLLISGGQEAVDVVIKSLPVILLAIFLVNIIKAIGIIQYIEMLVTPVFNLLGLPSVAVLPIVTKFLAGDTAMLGVTMDLVKAGEIAANELNRLAGFMINPLDLVGVAVLISAGSKVASIAKPAVMGAVCGLMLKAAIHLMIF